jgi:hypothetical protein
MIIVNEIPLPQPILRYCYHHGEISMKRADFLVRFYDKTAGMNGLYLAKPVCRNCKDYVASSKENNYGEVEIVPISII